MKRLLVVSAIISVVVSLSLGFGWLCLAAYSSAIPDNPWLVLIGIAVTVLIPVFLVVLFVAYLFSALFRKLYRYKLPTSRQ